MDIRALGFNLGSFGRFCIKLLLHGKPTWCCSDIGQETTLGLQSLKQGGVHGAFNRGTNTAQRLLSSQPVGASYPYGRTNMRLTATHQHDPHVNGRSRHFIDVNVEWVGQYATATAYAHGRHHDPDGLSMHGLGGHPTACATARSMRRRRAWS